MILAVVLFVIAGGVAVYNVSSGNSTALDEEGRELPEDARMIDVVCVGNGAHAQLPPDQVKMESFTPRTGRTRAGGSADLVPPTQYDCPDCPGGKAVLAIACPKCEKFVARKKMDGSPGECPNCGIKVGS